MALDHAESRGPVKFTYVSGVSSTNNQVVAAVTGKKIRVLSYVIVANGTVNAKFQSASGGTDITGLLYLVANSGVSSSFNPVGQFETVSGQALFLNLSAAVATSVNVTYQEV